MSAPRLSVLLPVYNGEQYIAQTIDSILSQSFADFELLVLDDGSMDRTPEIVARYQRIDWRVRVFSHSNRGVGLTLDRGISEARGTLIAEIGADDLALPGRLAKQVAFFEQSERHVLVGTNLRIIDSSGRVIGHRGYPIANERLKAVLPIYNPFASPSIMYRHGDAVAAGGYNSRFSTCEDYDFFLRLALRGSVANLPEALTAYRLHESSTKWQRTRRQLRDTIAIRRAASNEYGYPNTIESRASLFAQQLIALLPARLIYWAFVRWAIEQRVPCQDGPSTQ